MSTQQTIGKLTTTLLLIIFMATICKATFDCFGKSDLDSGVCNGQGTCVANNTCTCNVGFFGEQCEIMAPRYNISTIAGTGSAGNNGNIGPGNETMLSSPQGVAVSDIGEVYIADSTNNYIRKLFLNGTVQIIAGTTQGYSGDYGQAMNCQFFSPQGLYLSSTGVLFVADTLNNVLRKINLGTGIITPVVGSGNPGYTSPGDNRAVSSWALRIRGVYLSPTGELAYSDSDNNLVRKEYNNGIYDIYDMGSGTRGIPYQVAVNSDLEVFFADQKNHVVVRVTHTGTVSTVVGGGSSFGDGGLATNAQVFAPRGIAVSSSGEWFVADSGNNRLRKVFKNGIIVTIAGTSSVGYSGDGGLGTSAKLNNPVNIAIRQTRNLSEIYFADAGNHAIRKLTAFCEDTHILIDGLCYIQCFGKANQDNGVCSGKGNCSSPNQCTCNEGYYGNNCEQFDCNGVSVRNNSVCSGNGLCSSPENCTCSTGYYGTNCEFFDCFGVNSMNPSVCSTRGKCTVYNNCSCNTGYYGQSCEFFNCFGLESNSSRVCSSHGLCSDYNTCNCTNGYYGESCQHAICFGIRGENSSVCSGRGLCSQVDTCQCQDGYYGSSCEKYNCSGKINTDPTACSGIGICAAYNNCTCPEGYYGVNCEKFNCFDINKDSENVCFTHGTCSSYNNCTCFNGYSGKDCSQYSCYGISSLNSSACSGHGICSYSNNCTCFNGYSGHDCSQYSCYGISPLNSSACSGHGICSHSNNCTCSTGYYGLQCESFTCFGISKDNSTGISSCNGHGLCSSYNNCTCFDGYFGKDCKNYTCFNQTQTSPDVCSSSGVCVDNNVCLCLNGTSGNRCEIRPVSSQPRGLVSLAVRFTPSSRTSIISILVILFMWTMI